MSLNLCDCYECQGRCAHPFSMCGYSNCFRSFFRMRGFMPVCQVHADDPVKRPATASVFVRTEAEVLQ